MTKPDILVDGHLVQTAELALVEVLNLEPGLGIQIEGPEINESALILYKSKQSHENFQKCYLKNFSLETIQYGYQWTPLDPHN